MLACERHGRGEPLVLVHGVTHRRQAWYPVVEELAEDREVILVDLPGHGASPPLPADGRPVTDLLREQFRQFLADEGLVRPHVAGNSLGGLVALVAGAEGDARSVTALSPAGFWTTRAHFSYTRHILRTGMLSERLGARVELLAHTRAGRRLMYGLICAHPARISSAQALGDIQAFRYARPTLQLMLDAAAPFDRQIPNDVPVTIAWGARDLVLPPWQAEVAKRLVPHAEHVMLRGVGHVPMSDDPHAVAQVLLRGSAPVAVVTAAPVRRSEQARAAVATTASVGARRVS